jgi:hypothetical protein
MHSTTDESHQNWMEMPSIVFTARIQPGVNNVFFLQGTVAELITDKENLTRY